MRAEKDTVALQGYHAFKHKDGGVMSVARFALTFQCDDADSKTIVIAIQDTPSVDEGSRPAWKKLERRLRRMAGECSLRAAQPPPGSPSRP